MNHPLRILLTGTTGYVGSHVAEQLVAEGHALAVTVRVEREDAAARRLGAWPVRLGLGNTARLAELASEVDAVVHCVASEDPGFPDVNAAAVAAMLAALRPGCGFVLAENCLLFGDTGDRVLDGSEALAPPPGLEARAALARRVLEAGRARGLRTAVVHAALAYGGTGGVVPTTLLRATLLAGTGLHPAGPERIWSTVHVADWAGLIVRAASRTPVGGTAYVAAGEPWPIRSVSGLLAAALGLPGTAPVPRATAEAHWGPLGPALFLNQVFSPARAGGLLGWVPVEECLEGEIARLGASQPRRPREGSA